MSQSEEFEKYATNVFRFLLVVNLCELQESDCINEISDVLISPDGKKKMVLFFRNCGATTGLNVQGTILNVADQLQNEAGNTFVLEGEVRVTWTNNNEILVAMESFAHVYKQENSVSGVVLEYRKGKLDL